MLTLVTGVPGSGKTLNTIKMIDQEHKDRPVYYHNIPDLELDWIALDDPLEWNSLPEGSVIVLDECQRTFPRRANGARVPEHVSALETHRHKGYDIYLITQMPTLIDYHVRDLVGRHIHLQRNFGLGRVTAFSWEYCCVKPREEKFKAVKKTLPLDKKYFGKYKSAVEHTHKAKIPKKLYGIVFIGLASVSLLSYAVSNFDLNKSDNVIEANNPAAVSESSTFFSLNNKEPELDYWELHTPRIAGLPHTAPVYDEINEPKEAPFPNCISSEYRCRCYTQQATLMNIEEDVCRSIIANGLWNPARGGHSDRGADPAPERMTALEHYQKALEIRKEIAELSF